MLVLSNNDDCTIARSQKAKNLGVETNPYPPDWIPAAEHKRVAAGTRAPNLNGSGIPWCVGIRLTKTSTKSGNKAAKKTPHGVMTALPGSSLLESFELKDAWGLGHRTRAKLDVEDILTAAEPAHLTPTHRG